MRALRWIVVIALSAIGVMAGVNRALHPVDAAGRFEPHRARALEALGIREPDLADRAREVRRFESTFARHQTLTLLHVVPGALFLLLAPVQLAAGVRSRLPRLHRWSGRVAVLAGLASGGAALFFGLVTPFAGVAESVVVGLFGGAFVVALARGYAAIRAGDLARHREWMIRAFALGVGIATIRLVAAALDVVLTPAGYSTTTIFLISLWVGWLVSLGGAELWLRRTRGRILSASSTPSARDDTFDDPRVRSPRPDDAHVRTRGHERAASPHRGGRPRPERMPG